MSEPLTDAACTPECARLMARLAGQGNRLRDEVDECAAEVQRLRAENADLAEQLRREMEAYAAQAYRQDCRGEGTCSLGITDGRECRRHMLEALDRLHTRADRYAAALVHIESRGHHHATCIPAGEWRCDPDCPTATAKKAREDR